MDELLINVNAIMQSSLHYFHPYLIKNDNINRYHTDKHAHAPTYTHNQKEQHGLL